MAKLAVFDIDGTLLNSNEVDTACFVQSIEDAFGITGIDPRWEVYEHVTDAGVFGEIFEKAFAREPAHAEIRKHQARFLELLKEQYAAEPGLLREISGARELLSRLKQNPEWTIGVATGGWRETAMFKLETACFDVADIQIVTSSDSKSRARIVRECIEKSLLSSGVTGFDHIVSVGDAIWDARTAAGLRIGFVGIGSRHKFSSFTNCRSIPDYSDHDTAMRCLDEAEVPRLT